MKLFAMQSEPIEIALLDKGLRDSHCGAVATFAGRVRDHHDGRSVDRLVYEAYTKLAQDQGERIVEDAMQRFDIRHAFSVHRLGELGVGECSIWVGVSAAHRKPALAACEYIIDNIKSQVPIWKKEFFSDGTTQWVNCAACAQLAGNV